MHKPLAAASVALVTALALAGCSGTASGEPSADDGTIGVVASTSVYGSLAAQIGGDRVSVTSLIDSIAQDPHSYEASARDRLAVQGADLVIENGGGYDGFMHDLLEGSEAEVVTAVEFSHDFPGNEGHDEADAAEHDEHAHDESAEGEAADEHGHADEEHDHDHADHEHIEGFNEHVWFDAHTMIHVIEGIAAELGELDPAGADDFAAEASALAAELEGIEAELETIATEHGGTGVFLTEPLSGYLAHAAGLVDHAPEGFASAVEEGNDVAPATLLEAIETIESGEVAVLLTNAQTGGAETDRIEQTAEAAGIPIVAFTELPEPGTSYAEWMESAVQSLYAALSE